MIRIPRPVRMRRQADRRTIRAVAGLYLLLAMISWLAVPVVLRTSLVPSAWRAAAAAGQKGAVLIIAGPQESLPGYGLLRDALAVSGFASYLHILPDHENTGPSAPARATGAESAISQAIAETARLSGIPAEGIWVIACPQASSSVFAAMDPASVGGLVLLAPRSWPAQAVALQSGWADNGQIAILAAPTTDRAANRFFEALTGEDATLFPGSPMRQAVGGTAWLSADGRVSLTLLPGHNADFALISPLMLAEVTASLYDRQEQLYADSLTASAAVASQVATRLYRLAVSLLLLLSVPFVASLLQGQNEREAKGAAAGGLAGELLFWLAALIMAATVSWLLLRVTASQISWLAWLVLLAPGCHGWIHLLWRVFVLRPEQAPDEPASPSQINIAALPAVLLLPVLLVLILLPMPGYWPAGQVAWLILLVIVSLAIGPVGAGSGHSTLRGDGKSGWSCLIRFIPWLLLPVVVLIISGPLSALVAVLIALAACWSSRCGLAVARISRSRWLGSLVQSFCHIGLIFPLAVLLQA